jgi:hypothetical protein
MIIRRSLLSLITNKLNLEILGLLETSLLILGCYLRFWGRMKLHLEETETFGKGRRREGRGMEQ